MKDDKRHLQLRLDGQTRQELEELAKKYRITISDTVRGILFFGIPVFEAMTDLSERLVRRMTEYLKREARMK